MLSSLLRYLLSSGYPLLFTLYFLLVLIGLSNYDWVSKGGVYNQVVTGTFCANYFSNLLKYGSSRYFDWQRSKIDLACVMLVS